jgi:hypothetical protein
MRFPGVGRILPIAVLSASCCFARMVAQTASPLEVVTAPVENQIVRDNATVTITKVAFDVRNVSTKCIVAISLSVRWKDSNGKSLGTGGISTFRHKDAQFDCLQPNEIFHFKHSVGSVPLDESGNPAKTVATVDFVIFGDGSTWGPGDRAEEKGRLMGKFQAYRQLQSQTDK